MANKDVSIKNLQFDLSQTDFKMGDSSREFTGTAYSGLPIMAHPFWGNLIFDTTTISAEPKVPILFNHDPGRIVGFGTIRTDGAIFVDGNISKVTEEGRMIEGLLDEGFPMKESVYIEPETVQKFSKGQKFTVNDQDLVGPFTVFRNSKIKEVSMTPLPADINTSTQIFNERLESTINLKEQEMKSTKNIAVNAKDTKKEFAIDAEDLSTDPIEAISQVGEELERVITDATAEVVEAVTGDAPEETEETEEESTDEETPEFKDSADNTKLFSDLIKSGDLKKAFEFACSCERKASNPKSDLEELQEKFDSLMGKYNDLQNQVTETERFSIIDASGHKFSDESKKTLAKLEKEELEKVLKDIGMSSKPGKRKINPKLFVESSKSDDAIQFDENDANQVYEAAMKFKKMQEAKGIKVKNATVEMFKALNK